MKQMNMTTLARPYALAAFEFALAEGTVPAWESMLALASLVTQDASVQRLLVNPEMSSAQLVSLYCDVLAKCLNPEMTNFIRLLAEYDRLSILPDIAELFSQYRTEQEKKIDVEVVSAVQLNDQYQKKLIDLLNKRLKRKVQLTCKTDPTLLGGVVVTAGDTVIDGSVRGKLDRMVKFISDSL